MTRNEAKRLIKRSGLNTPGKVVFGWLLHSADNRTCLVPVKYAPTVADIVDGTGLARSTVFHALVHLEAHGWIKRSRERVGRSFRTTYTLMAGAACLPDCPLRSKPKGSRSLREAVHGPYEKPFTVPRADSHGPYEHGETAGQSGSATKGNEGKGLVKDDWPELPRCAGCGGPMSANDGQRYHPCCDPEVDQ